MSTRVVRFWEYVNGSWVRLTVRAGGPLQWGRFERTDEGSSFESCSWRLSESNMLVREWTRGGRDCDGRVEARGTDSCFVYELAAVPAYEEEDGSHTHEGRAIMRPKWGEEDARVREYRDEFAEAAGY